METRNTETTRCPTRRQFLRIAGTIAATAVGGSAMAAARRRKTKGDAVKIYRLSLRGRRGCRAAKEVCANLRFTSKRDATLYTAKFYDNPRVVGIVVSRQEFERLFVRRAFGRVQMVPVADMRQL